jgi:hypothetical protein
MEEVWYIIPSRQANMETDKPKLTPAEELFQRLERPLRNINIASELNNDAVALFTEGKLTTDQLTKFSMGLARQADALAQRIYKTDIKENPMPETKQLAYSTMQALAQENRNRATILTLERQRRQPAQTPRDVVMGKK